MRFRFLLPLVALASLASPALAQCAGGRCVMPTGLPVAAPAPAWRLADSAGQVWVHPDRAYLERWVYERNAAASRRLPAPPIYGTPFRFPLEDLHPAGMSMNDPAPPNLVARLTPHIREILEAEKRRLLADAGFGETALIHHFWPRLEARVPMIAEAVRTRTIDFLNS